MTPGRRCADDVAVVGAGVIGATIAWRAAQRGVRVTLIDETPGAGASYAAAGMLGAVAEAGYGAETLVRLCMESARRFPSFVEEVSTESGLTVAHNTLGTLVIAFDDDDQRELSRLQSDHNEFGFRSSSLTSRECRLIEPLLSPRLRGGLMIDGDHAVDPRGLLTALLAAGERAGVRLLRDRVTGIRSSGGITGVQVQTGAELPAATVVLATGAWSGVPGKLAGLPDDVLPPVRPVKGQVLRLRGASGPMGLAHVVRGWSHGSPVYVVPYGDGRVVVGATSEDLGFDTTVRVGGVYELLRDALALVPALGQLELVEATAGLRPGTPDNAPLIGETALPGLLLATGHYRNGVLLAPITGDAIAALLTGEVLPAPADAFSPLRFRATPKPRPEEMQT